MRGEVKITIDYKTAICLIAQIQLASRHPDNKGDSQKIAEHFARQLQKWVSQVKPEDDELIESGWMPPYEKKNNHPDNLN